MVRSFFKGLKPGSIGFVFFISFGADARVLWDDLDWPTSIHSAIKGGKKRGVLEIGFEAQRIQTDPFRSIVLENDRTSTRTRSGDENIDWGTTWVQTLRGQLLFSERSKWSVQFQGEFPVNSLITLDSGPMDLPDFPVERTQMKKPKFRATLATDAFGFRWGFGVDTQFSADASATVFLQSGSGRTSDQRLIAKANPVFRPVFSGAKSFYGHDFQFFFLPELKSKLSLSTSGGARLASENTASIDFAYTTTSALFFDPMRLGIVDDWKISEFFQWKAGIVFERWSTFQSTQGTIQGSDQFEDGSHPQFTAIDRWVPMLGFQVQPFESQFFELGYQREASIFQGLPTGRGNLNSPVKNIIQVGYIWNGLRGLDRLWIRLTYQYWQSQNVVKQDSNEIGGPGYTVKGSALGGSLGLQWNLGE